MVSISHCFKGDSFIVFNSTYSVSNTTYNGAYKEFTDTELIQNYQKVEPYLSIYSDVKELEEKAEEHDESIEQLKQQLEAKDQELETLKDRMNNMEVMFQGYRTTMLKELVESDIIDTMNSIKRKKKSK